MDNKNNKKLVVTNLVWRFLERTGAQLVGFIVSIILARILAPEVYGIIALVTVFTGILQVFVDSGMGNALIQKKEADDLDFSTVFYFNILICTLIYLIMFLFAPYIASFYNYDELVSVIRVLSLTLVISGVKNVQQAYVSKTMQFKRFFYSTIGGTLISAVIGIIMAYKGFGVWALVVQQISNCFIDTMILWITVKWRPKFCFSLERLKGLFGFGWKLLASSLLDKIFNELRQLIIGRIYTVSDLAYYNKGNQFPNMVVTNINTAIDSVLLPTMSNVQDDSDKVKSMTRRAIKTSTYIMAPMMMGLAFIGTPLVRLILTEKWMDCVPYMRIFCITYMFYPIHTANLNAIKAMGRSDLFLKLEIIKKVIGLIILIITMRYGVMIMTYSLLGTSVINQIINSWPNKKLLKYSYSDQIKDILPSIVLSIVMGTCVYMIQLIELSDILTLCIQIPLGAVIYILGSKIFKLDSFEYILGILKTYIERKKGV